MKVLVCGGRDFTDGPFLVTYLDQLHAKQPISLLIHGDGRGADTLARAWAANRGVRVKAYPITRLEWRALGNAAGRIRNLKMLDDGCPDIVVAFPGGRGTRHMMVISQQRGIRVLRPSPSTSPSSK